MSTKTSELTERQRFWRDHLRRCEASGESVAAYAARHGLSRSAMYFFRRVLRARAKPLSAASPLASHRFVRAGVASATLPCRAHLRNGVVIEFGVAGEQLDAVLRSLAELA